MISSMESASGKRNPPVKVLLVDGDPLLREQLDHIITAEHDLVVCGHAEDRDKAMQLAETNAPELVITDLWLKKSHGLELIKDLQARFPNVLILVVSSHDSWFYAARAIRAGARGYVTNRATAETIMEAIRRLLQGETYLTDKLAKEMNTRLASSTFASRQLTAAENLTDRELEVFELVGLGLDSRQIAEQMRLDVSTVDTYRAHIKAKLGLKDSSELLRQAIAWVHGPPPTKGSGLTSS